MKSDQLVKEFLLFKIKIHSFTRREYSKIIYEAIENNDQIVQNGINAASILEIKRNEKLADAYNHSNLNNIDGMSIFWALRLLNYHVCERVPCPDLAEDVLALAENHQYKVFLFGAQESNLLLAKDNIKAHHPNIKIAGYRNGYYQKNEEREIVDLINASQSDILFLALPSPQKEFFMEKYKAKLRVKYALGVGGYFDILAGKIKRAPFWMQKHGLEWFYRLIQEPRRMWKRYLFGNTIFICLVFKEKIKQVFRIK